MSQVKPWTDTPARLLFVPLVGLAVSHAAGLYGSIRIGSAWYWVAAAYFTFVSLALWEGNRILWFRLRGRPDWAVAPWQRFLVVGSGTLLYSVPACALLLWLWFRATGFPMRWDAIAYATLLSAAAAGFIVHIYETVDLIKQRARERVAREKLEHAKALAELAVLKTQIGPHFVFNCLNTLAGLIETSPEQASRFTVRLANLYRYLLDHREADLVPLADEISFLIDYHELLNLRFGGSIDLVLPAPRAGLVPPVSLQVLLENAAKHNDAPPAHPLRVTLSIEGDAVVMRNEIRRQERDTRGTGLGLSSLDQRCRLVTGRPLVVSEGDGIFEVRVPLVNG